MSDFYSLSRFKGKTDLDGNVPSTYFICNNRSAGKTTAVLLKFLEDWDSGKQFFLLYRNKYEILAANLIFGECERIRVQRGLQKQEREYAIVKYADGLFVGISIDGEVAGYAFYIQSADKLKKYSSVFSGVENGFLDEFQIESGKYAENEYQNVQSIIVSVARGGGKRARNINMYFCSNPVDDVNPYYLHTGIYKRLRKDAKFIRGNGWILDCEQNSTAAQEMENSSTLKSFEDDAFMGYLTGRRNLHSRPTNIKKLNQRSIYIATIQMGDAMYSVRKGCDTGVIWVGGTVDQTFPVVVRFGAEINYETDKPILVRGGSLYRVLKYGYESGNILFGSVEAMTATYKILAIGNGVV